jgi:hypothetical protein
MTVVISPATRLMSVTSEPDVVAGALTCRVSSAPHHLRVAHDRDDPEIDRAMDRVAQRLPEMRFGHISLPEFPLAADPQRLRRLLCRRGITPNKLALSGSSDPTASSRRLGNDGGATQPDWLQHMNFSVETGWPAILEITDRVA